VINELWTMSRALDDAGLPIGVRHPAIKDVRRAPTLVVKLAEDGSIAAAYPLSPEIRIWTMRDGQHNSFPFVQLRRPLWDVAVDDIHVDKLADHRQPASERRSAILELNETAKLNAHTSRDLATTTFIRKLEERLAAIREGHPDEDAQILLDTITRFIEAVDFGKGSSAPELIEDLAQRLVGGISASADDAWLDVAAGLLVGRRNGASMACVAAVVFDVARGSRPVYDERVALAVSRALMPTQTAPGGGGAAELCALTGQQTPVVKTVFPQPNLPELGQTWLFAKNDEAPANDRYGHSGTQSYAVGEMAVSKASAALRYLVRPESRNVTWRSIPSERDSRDLLVAFVEGIPEARAAELLADDLAQEEDIGPSIASSRLFRERTRRMMETIEGKSNADPRSHLVRLVILRKVDPANRKAIHTGVIAVGNLLDSADQWEAGVANLPAGLTLPILRKDRDQRKSSAISIHPPHVAPMSITGLSRAVYTRGGTERQDVPGLRAVDGLALFLVHNREIGADRNVSLRWLRRLLRGWMPLFAGIAHAQCRQGPVAIAHDFPCWDALKCLSLLGVVLLKLGRDRRVYMDATGFKLGQLLAVADAVHAGYCADVRKGSLPPSLLGNQVFTMAQTNPTAALATLCRRWKPYDGWAKKVSRDLNQARGMAHGAPGPEKERGWMILTAVRASREVGPIAALLANELSGAVVDDAFRAELLLGYLAGLPRSANAENTSAPAGVANSSGEPVIEAKEE